MKPIAIAGILALAVYLAYVSASIERGYIASSSVSCSYMRNQGAGQKECLASAPVSSLSPISGNFQKCPITQDGCEPRNK